MDGDLKLLTVKVFAPGNKVFTTVRYPAPTNHKWTNTGVIQKLAVVRGEIERTSGESYRAVRVRSNQFNLIHA